MPATNKNQLLSVTEKEFAKLWPLLEVVTDAQALETDDEDTAIKDVVAHRAHWIALFFGWYGDGQADKPVFFPAEGYKWNELKRYNADLKKRQASLSWAKARSDLEKAHRRLVNFLRSASEDDLYGGPMKGAKNGWTTGRWAEAAGASHYRSASKYVRSRLKNRAG